VKTDLLISLAQVPVIKGNIEANLSNHISLVEASSHLGADVVVFPELSLTGYELALLERLAFDKNSSNILTLSEAAIQYDITIIAGCPLSVPNSVKPTISAVICFPNGQVDFYSKQYLHSGEEQYCSVGGDDYLFIIKGYKIALAICADFSSPAHALKAKKAGADLYLVSALISDSGFKADAQILSNIAVTHQLPVLLSNHISSTGGWFVCGNNSVWGKSGKLVLASQTKKTGVILCSVRGEEIKEVVLR